MSNEVRIVPMTRAHADAVLAIYSHGIDEGNATFETAAPPWETFDKTKLPGHRFVAVDDDGTVRGWVAVSPVSDRSAYAGVVEHSVYVHPSARGCGIGSALLQCLIRSTETAGIWTIQSGIFPENAASLALHERAGFRVIGTRERVGRQHGIWRDVLLIERRSPVVELADPGEHLFRPHAARWAQLDGRLVGQLLQHLVHRGRDAVLAPEQHDLAVEEVGFDRACAPRQALP